MSNETRQRILNESPRSIALGRQRSPRRWLADELRSGKLTAVWPWTALAAVAGLAGLILL